MGELKVAYGEDAISEKLDVLGNKIERAVEMQDWRQARLFASQAVRIAGAGHWFHDRLGVALTELGEFSDAARAFKKGVSIAPTCPRLNLDYAGFLFAQGKERDGLNALQPIVSVSLNSLRKLQCDEGKRVSRSIYLNALSDAGIAAFRLRKYDESARYFRRHLLHRQRGTPAAHTLIEMQKAYAAARARSGPKSDRQVSMTKS